MPLPFEIRFGSFCFTPDNGILNQGEAKAYLTPKDSAVLLALVENAGQLVSKSELMHKVWPDVAVWDDVIKACIKRVRKMLGDDFKTPRFIETIHRRRYRFVCPIIAESSAALCPVGRENELRQLSEHLDLACGDKRQVIFIVGEAGIGKRMLRELAVTLEKLSLDIPVVIFLEDLHWSDYATLDAINRIARRQECAQLMIVGTFRPEDLAGPATRCTALSRSWWFTTTAG